MTKYLVLTGGSRGIGAATITLFIEHGWKAINISRTPCLIPGVTNFTADLAKPENIEAISSDLLKALPNASSICLIHNAVFQTADTVSNVSLEDLLLTLNINLISSTLLNKILIPVMKPGSSILYMGSMLANTGVPGNASYIISKHAVLGLMRSTCQDLRGRDISTSCVCPGLVDTELLRTSMDEKLINYVLDAHIVGKRLINPTEIAKVLYTCATTPVFNGAVIPANLGLIAG